MDENKTPETNPTPPATTPAPAAAPATPAATGEVKYAGFWIRFVAALIDGIILGIALSPLLAFLPSGNTGGLNTASAAYSGPDFFANTVRWAAGLVYGALMISSTWQATLGKKALGLKVTDVDGKRLAPGKAFLREGSKLVSAAILGIGYIMAGFDAKKQGLHDKIAGTLVVKSK